jgi:hypothetical protein
MDGSHGLDMQPAHPMLVVMGIHDLRSLAKACPSCYWWRSPPLLAHVPRVDANEIDRDEENDVSAVAILNAMDRFYLSHRQLHSALVLSEYTGQWRHFTNTWMLSAINFLRSILIELQSTLFISRKLCCEVIGAQCCSWSVLPWRSSKGRLFWPHAANLDYLKSKIKARTSVQSNHA